MAETETIKVPIVLEDKVSGPAQHAGDAVDKLGKKTVNLSSYFRDLEITMGRIGGRSGTIVESLRALGGVFHSVQGHSHGAGEAGASAMQGITVAALAAFVQVKTLETGVEALVGAAKLAIGITEKLYERFTKLHEVERAFELKEGETGIARLDRMTERAHQMGLELDFAREMSAKLEQSWQPDDAEALLGVIQDLSVGAADVPKSMEAMQEKLNRIAVSPFVKGGITKGFFRSAAGGAETEVEFYKQLAKIKGISVEAAMALEKHGKISGQEWVKALYAADKAKNGVKEFGDKALEASKGSLPAQVQRVTDSFKLMGDEIAKDVFGGQDMADSMGKLADSIDEIAKDKDFQAFLKDVGSTFRDIGKSVITFATEAMPKVRDAFKWLKDNQDVVEAVGIGIAVVVGGLFLLFAGVFGLLGAVAMAIGAVVLVGTVVVGSIVYALMHAGDAWDWLKDKFDKGFKWFEGLADDFRKAGTDIIAGLIEGITSKEPELAGAIKQLAIGIKDSVKDALHIRSPSLVMAGLGENVSLGMAQGIRKGQGDVEAASAGIASAPVSAGGTTNNRTSFGSVQVTNEFHMGGGGTPMDQSTIDRITAAQRRVIEEVMMTVVSQAQVQS